MTIFTIPGLILWLFIIPFCIGLIPMPWIPEKNRNVGVTVAAGYLIMLPLCWLVTVPCILLVEYDSFLVMVRWFTVLLAAGAAAGIGICIWAARKGKRVLRLQPPDIMEMTWGERLGWLVFLGLVAWQLYKAFTLTSFDGDDAEYVAQSLVTVQSNTMYRILPYTGGTTSLDIRHSLAVLPIWIAYIGRMTGLHTTILAHSVLPFVWIPLTYMVFYEIGKHLFRRKTEKAQGGLSLFMVFIALFQMFGNVSIYTNETFFLTRTWQGKAVAASFVIPVTIWLMLWIFDGEEEKKRRRKKEPVAAIWVLLVLTNMTAGVCTSMVVFLNVVLIGAAAFWLMIAEKKFSILIKAGCVNEHMYSFSGGDKICTEFLWKVW